MASLVGIVSPVISERVLTISGHFRQQAQRRLTP